MKVKTSLIAFILMVFMSCGSSSASKQGDSVNAESVDISSEPLGMLKAFGLKGKVKTLTLSTDEDNSDEYVYSFDTEGNLLDYPDYNGGSVTKELSTPFLSCDMSFDKWKWTEMNFAGRFIAETAYEMTKYDSDNRPISANVLVDGVLAKKNASISYSGEDAKGNYRKIHFDTSGLNYDESGAFPYILGTLNVEFEYWPENASAADVPTKLSEKEAIKLIQRANNKKEEALSIDLKEVVDKDGGMSTIINYSEFAYVPDIAIEIVSLNISNTGDAASVVFYFAPVFEGKYDKSCFNDDEYLRIAEFVYENGKWKVDDIGWDVGMSCGLFLAQQWYKEYKRKCRR